MTEEEYLALDRAAESRSEYHHGQMFAMAGGSDAHAMIGGNLFAALKSALKGKRCRPNTGELRIRIPQQSSYVYADAMVLCGEERLAGGKDFTDQPVLVAEVLSHSTEAFDRGAKFALYKAIPSCREYLLVSQDQPLVELFSRRPYGEGWLLTEASGLAASIRIESLVCSLALADIYDDVKLPT